MTYNPREDTRLVLRNLEDMELEGKKFLEIGTGSGAIAVKAAELGAEVTATDIDPEALEEARNRARDREVEAEFVESDLFENVTGKYDITVFNPPYLPGEEGLGDEETWRGGEKGTETSRRFLSGVKNFLADEGFFLLVASSLADSSALKEEHDLELVDSEKLWFEELYLLKGK
ncbi:MAG: HemK2/MTQ2 family protein methyltransferase [Candidatus Nanohaloarchaea archaeon]